MMINVHALGKSYLVVSLKYFIVCRTTETLWRRRLQFECCKGSQGDGVIPWTGLWREGLQYGEDI